MIFSDCLRTVFSTLFDDDNATLPFHCCQQIIRLFVSMCASTYSAVKRLISKRRLFSRIWASTHSKVLDEMSLASFDSSVTDSNGSHNLKFFFKRFQAPLASTSTPHGTQRPECTETRPTCSTCHKCPRRQREIFVLAVDVVHVSFPPTFQYGYCSRLRWNNHFRTVFSPMPHSFSQHLH